MPLINAGRAQGALKLTGIAVVGTIAQTDVLYSAIVLTGRANAGYLLTGTASGILQLSGEAHWASGGRALGTARLTGRAVGSIALSVDNDPRNHIDRDTKGLLPNSRVDTSVGWIVDGDRVGLRTPFTPTASQVHDSSGNAHDATTLGGPAVGVSGLLSGDADTAFGFDGQAIVLDSVLSGLSGSFTLEFLIMYSASVSNQYVFDTFSPRHLVYIDPSGNLQLSSGGAGQLLGSLAPNARHHVVLTFDAIASTATCYIDGVGTGTATYTPSTFGSATRLMNGYDVLTTPTTGTLDEFAFYQSVLAGSRVTAHYTAVAGGGYAASVLADTPYVYYRLGDSATSTGTAGDITRDDFGLGLYTTTGWHRIGLTDDHGGGGTPVGGGTAPIWDLVTVGPDSSPELAFSLGRVIWARGV